MRARLAHLATARRARRRRQWPTAARAWNRPPIDRHMVQPQHSSARRPVARPKLVGAVERGVYVETKLLVVDRRFAQQVPVRLRVGPAHRRRRLREVVKNPTTRASRPLLAQPGGCRRPDTVQVLAPVCGKGEPNQIIRVGHAAPACLFRGVEVGGAESLRERRLSVSRMAYRLWLMARAQVGIGHTHSP